MRLVLLENFIKSNNLVLASEFTKANSTQFNRIKSVFRGQNVKNLVIYRIERKDPSYSKNKEFFKRHTNCDTVSSLNILKSL